VPFTTNVVISNANRGEVYSIQHYVIKYVSDLRQDGVFFQ
jgi:phosphatidylinositol kinase/protein kinase (PI-3  family)